MSTSMCDIASNPEAYYLLSENFTYFYVPLVLFELILMSLTKRIFSRVRAIAAWQAYRRVVIS